MKKLIPLLLIPFFIGTISCTTTSSYSLYPKRKVTRSSVALMTPGVSTTDDAIKLFGLPTSESNMFGGNVLYQWQEYIGSTGAHIAILFNKSGTMIELQHKTFIGM
ncbi:hypothetical protein P4E94_19395 [Pontiellaceae bacterium B12219]|nr:hypothetical protein [Pontiellaceae bacterium B12219]